MDKVRNLVRRPQTAGGVPIIGAQDSALQQRMQQVAAYSQAAHGEALKFLKFAGALRDNTDDVMQAYAALIDSIDRLEELGLPDTIVMTLQQTATVIEGYINGIAMAIEAGE
jgi:hypothetical protein